jgi:hypothetical protein
MQRVMASHHPYSLLPTAHCIQAEPDDPREREANAFAQEMLISADAWERKRSILLPDPSERAVRNVAQELRISPAIVAGRIRWETQDYKQLGALDRRLHRRSGLQVEFANSITSCPGGAVQRARPVVFQPHLSEVDAHGVAAPIAREDAEGHARPGCVAWDTGSSCLLS